MGKIIKREKDIFINRIQDHLTKSTEDYSRFFEGRPVFVTYYSRNRYTSTVDGTLETTLDDVGIDSPNRYDKIDNLPLYSISGIDISEDMDDFGMETNYEGDATCIPSLIRPLEGDFFCFPEFSDILYKVTSVLNDKISGKQFYKIGFSIANNTISDINKQVEKELEVDYDLIGKKDTTAILEKKDAAILKDICEVSNALRDFYRENFYNEGLNYIHIKISGIECYDDFLTLFISKHKLLQSLDIKDSYESLFIYPIQNDKDYDNIYLGRNYNNTLYYALEISDTKKFTMNKYTLHNNTNQLNELAYAGLATSHITYLNGTIDIFDSNFIENLTSNTLYNELDDDFQMENFLIKYFNITLETKEIINILGDIEYYNDIKTFIFIPCILYILHDRYKKIIQK